MLCFQLMKLMLIVISIVARPQLATSSALFEDRFPNMVSNQGPMRVMNISTGLELVDHLRNLKNGEDLVLVMPGDVLINVADAVISNETSPMITSGVVRLVAQPGAHTVLDTAARSMVSTVMSGNSAIIFQNVTFVGLCAVRTTRIPGTYWTGVTNAVFMQMRQSIETIANAQRFLHYGANIITTQAEVSMYIYWHVILDTRMDGLQPWRSQWLQAVADTQAIVSSVSSRHIRFQSASFPLGQAYYYSLTTASPGKPVVLPWTNTPVEVVDRPIRHCNLTLGPRGGGREVTPEEFATNYTVSPLWVADTEAQAHAALAAAQQWSQKTYSHPGTPATWPASVMILANTSLAMNETMSETNATTQGPYRVMGQLLIKGPFNHIQATAFTVALDFGNATRPLLHVPAGSPAAPGQLFLHKLTLTGLPVQTLPDLSTQDVQAGAETKSALPLWAISRDLDWDAPQVFLHNCTLVLPWHDFAALLEAALRSQMAEARTPGAHTDAWKTGAEKAASLMRGVTTFVPSPNQPHLTEATDTFVLTAYTGWGVNATSLYITHGLGSRGAAQSKSGGSNKVAVGVGVGVGVGGAMVAVAVVGWVLLSRRNKGNTTSSLLSTAPKGGGSNDALMPPAPIWLEKIKGADGSDKATSSSLTLLFEGSQSLLKLCQEESIRTQASDSKGPLPQPSPPSLQHADHGRMTRAVEAAAAGLQMGDPNRLTLARVIGQGSWGVVYRGKWRGLDVAVKTMVFSSRVKGKDSVGRVLAYDNAVREAAVCTSVLHTNIVTTYHYDFKQLETNQQPGQRLEVDVGGGGPGCSDFKLYLIQEYCNTTLGAVIRTHVLQRPQGPIFELIMALLLDVAHGLEYLHDKGIIHSDLKPDNVLLKPERSSLLGITAKVADFGLAAFISPTDTHVSNYKGGTPIYVAPEVVAHARLSKASDIFALGVIMWEMVNTLPLVLHEADGSYKRNPAFPTFLPPTTDPIFASLMQRCLNTQPDARPSASEAANQLVALLQQRGVAAVRRNIPAPAAPTQGPSEAATLNMAQASTY